jgi:predicted PurR-regulated permease PerM
MNNPFETPPTTTSNGGVDLESRQRWAHRRDIAIATLGGLAILALVVWVGAQVIHALLILLLAALIAYALTPAVKFLARFIPRGLAVLVVYLAFVCVIGAIGYLIVSTTAQQIVAFSGQVVIWLTPGSNGQPAPVIMKLEQLGVTQSQIQSVGDQLLSQSKDLANSAVPVLEGIFGLVVDAILVTVLSIYLLMDGPRVVAWLRTSAPLRQRRRVSFMMLTIERVVGGYIRGQLILSTLIGTLVGVGMAIFQVPYAVLLGVLAFILEFIPVIGVFISGALCILLALTTHGLILALIVLGYFVFVHIIEGDIVGPRVLGRAVGVHPAVSIFALIAGGELFGIWGALFASPLAGLIQAVLAEVWREWREAHSEMYSKDAIIATVPVTTAEAATIIRKATAPELPEDEEDEESASGMSDKKDKQDRERSTTSKSD